MSLLGEHMTGGYGGADILHDCTIGVDPGEIAVIVGTQRRGQVDRHEGRLRHAEPARRRVVMDGKDITGCLPQARVRKGMAFVPQTRNVFTSMTVEENLEMGAFIREDDFRDHGAGVRPVPDPEGKAPPARWRTLRRSAPAGRGRPGADDQAEGAHAGRTDGRACPPS
jgi:ABC-type branched-subunit amino acid transport system ATPase component